MNICSKCGIELSEKTPFFCPNCESFIPQEPSFIALEEELSRTTLSTVWRNKSLFEKLIAPPPILIQEFSEKWIQNVRKILGEGPFTSRYLVNLGEYIKKIRSLRGYTNIKRKLESLDQTFLPTLSEIEFIWWLLLINPIESIYLEYTFQTKRGRFPEIKVHLDSNAVFFEVTRIMDYKEVSLISDFYNTIISFQTAMKNIKKMSLKIHINFENFPSKDILKNVIKDINLNSISLLNVKDVDFNQLEIRRENYKANISKGNEVDIKIPTIIFENKIKDKLDEKTKKFDNDDINFVVIDVTSVILNMDELSNIVREYFDYSGNTTISGVILFAKRWSIKNNEPEYQYHFLHQPNLHRNDVDDVVRIIDNLFPKSTIFY